MTRLLLVAVWPSSAGCIVSITYRRDHACFDMDDKIWFYEVRADSYDPNKIVDIGRPETT
jgi:hypothetical protein